MRSPGTASGSKTKGMAAEAATASGSAPLSMSLYSPFLDTTPTANSCTIYGVSHGAHPFQAHEVLSCYRVASMVTEGQADRGFSQQADCIAAETCTGSRTHCAEVLKCGRQQVLQPVHHCSQGDDTPSPRRTARSQQINGCHPGQLLRVLHAVVHVVLQPGPAQHAAILKTLHYLLTSMAPVPCKLEAASRRHSTACVAGELAQVSSTEGFSSMLQGITQRLCPSCQLGQS